MKHYSKKLYTAVWRNIEPVTLPPQLDEPPIEPSLVGPC